MRIFSRRAQSVSHGYLERRARVGVSLLTKRSVQPVKISQTSFVPNASVGVPFSGLRVTIRAMTHLMHSAQKCMNEHWNKRILLPYKYAFGSKRSVARLAPAGQVISHAFE
ncbi:hypothetical protein BW686_22390 [Pseudomonas syringae]|uniref:Uncharacterized protein n=1 Tax=Pseudomonas syringae TaxID=317 RepID=A0A244ELA7_PSESX|nr:hypothetical protein BW686_22390 [Pseudomonas syringae]